MTSNTTERIDYLYKQLMIFALVIVGAIFFRDIIIPLAFAVIFSLAMLPVVKRIERKTGTILAATIVLLGASVIFVLLGFLLINQIINLVNDLPNLESKTDLFIDQSSATLQSKLNISIEEQKKMIQDVLKGITSYLGAVLLTTSATLTTLIQIPIYVFLFLIYREKFKLFFLSILPSNSTELKWQKEIESVIQGYISGLILVTLIIATMNTIGLLILGVDHAIFFGILTGVLTIIPYIGIFIGATLPVMMALVTKDSAWYAVGVIGVFSTVQFLEGNFISPRITGSKVSINALAAIIALLIGGKILGIAGMILAVPSIGVAKIFLSYSDTLKPFVILLGDDNAVDKPRDPTENAPPVQELKDEIKIKDPDSNTDKA
jgi:predicted PurR-regulated permease PerM